MKKSLFLCAAVLLMMIFVALPASAQSVVKWTATSKMTSKTEAVITLTATIDKGWHIYGLEPNEDGPIPTEITFAFPAGVKAVGKVTPTTKPVAQTDDMFGCEVTYWENKVSFTQKVKIDKKVKDATVKATVKYMSCNDASCCPPTTQELTVNVKSQKNK